MWLEIPKNDNDNEILKKHHLRYLAEFPEVVVNFKKIINRTVLD